MEGVLSIMSIFNKRFLTSSLVIMLSLGLAGCATSSATSTHKVNEATSTKVTNKNEKSATKDEHKNHSAQHSALVTENANTKASQSNNVSAITSSNAVDHSTTSSNVSGHSDKSNVASSSSQTNTSKVNTVVTTPSVTKHQSQSSQEIQLGLGDVASWTDDKGITHHVDSDGMDRQTISGSDQIHYQDWSGKLPQNATVSHND